MKYFFFASVIIILLAGCTSPDKLICRTWKVDELNFPPAKNDFDAKIQQSVKEQLHSIRFTFNADSTYQGGGKEGLNSGRWWFTDNKKAIIMLTGKINNHATILTLSKSKMVLCNTEQGIKFNCSPAKATK
jgi:hypothetical protein